MDGANEVMQEHTCLTAMRRRLPIARETGIAAKTSGEQHPISYP